MDFQPNGYYAEYLGLENAQKTAINQVKLLVGFLDHPKMSFNCSLMHNFTGIIGCLCLLLIQQRKSLAMLKRSPFDPKRKWRT